MPPNSFCEWVAGQNAPHSSAPKKPRPVFALQLETDDEYESDILKLTYPRTGQTRRPHGKKVRFTDNAHKVEAKEPLIQSLLDLDTDASSTAVEANSSDDEVATDEDLILDCPCTDCIAARRRLKISQTRGRCKKQQNVSTADGTNNATAVHARHKAKKAKEAEALKSKGGSSKRRAKQKSKHVNKRSDSEVETTETETDTEAGTGEETGSESGSESESESEKEPHKKKGKNKKDRQRKQNSQGKKTKQSEQNKKKNKQDSQKTKEGKWGGEYKNEKQDKQKDGRKQGTKENEGASKQDNLAEDKILQEADTIKKKRAEANQYPPQNPQYAPQQANFLMPPHARMLQVEHAVELPNDPRPNAFFDGVHGIMRVYHGPHYGNAYGQLYPNAPYVNHNPTVNVSYPAQNPWQAAGFQPFPGGQPPQPVPPPPPPQEASRHPPAATRRAPAENSWFQGYGSVTIGKPHEEAQEARGSNFTPDPSRKNNEAWSEQHSTPTKKPMKQAEKNSRSDRGGKSNVIPSIEITDPEKSQGSEGARGKPWGTQSAHDSQKASESKEEGNNGSKDTNKAGQSGGGGSFDDMIAKAEELYKTNSERFSPAPQNDGNGNFGNNNNGDWGGGGGSWGDGNNDATAGDNSWGEKDTQETTTGGTYPSKPTEDNSNGNSSGPAGGNASIDNVAVHGDPSDKKDGDNGSNNGGKRSTASSKRSTPPKGPPGCWVSNPPSENEDSKPRASPDNVGPPASGNGNGKKGKGKGKGKQKENGKSEDIQASANGNGNGGWGANTGWGDPDVAQSSGGAFDDDDKNKDGKEQQNVEW